MAQGRIRRLATRILRWVWVPVVAFVLVVAVAMGCAVWSPHQNWEQFAARDWGDMRLPSLARQHQRFPILTFPYPRDTGRYVTSGFGVSFYHMKGRDDEIHVCRAGFPFRCLRWTDDSRDTLSQTSVWVRGIETKLVCGCGTIQRYIPIRPELAGMLLNTLIVSAAIGLLLRASRIALVFHRQRVGLCPHCAYPVGDFTICPECGTPMMREA